MVYRPSSNSIAPPSAKAEAIYNRYVEGVHALLDMKDYKALVGPDKFIKTDKEYYMLARIFGKGRHGILRHHELGELKQFYGKHHPFVNELKNRFGVNDLKATRARAAWLANNTNQHTYAETTRAAMQLESIALTSLDATVDTADNNGLTPLMRAVFDGDTSFVSTLIFRGADVNFKTRHGRTSLMLAAGFCNAEITRLLISEDADINATATPNVETALIIATRGGCTEIVRMLLKKGAKSGSSALLLASSLGHTEIVRLFLKHGAAVNSSDLNGKTALMLAAQRGFSEIVRMLLEKGCDVNARDKMLRTALMCAVRNGYVEIAKMLLEKGAAVDLRDRNDGTALIGASEKCHEELVRLLIDSKADVNAKTSSGWTSLMLASRGGCSRTAELLIESGADINARNHSKESALTHAAKLGARETARLLLDAQSSLIEKGGQVHIEDFKGLHRSDMGGTLLMWASYGGYEALVKECVARIKVRNSKEKYINFKNDYGHTALMFAAITGRLTVIKLLIKNGADVTIQDKQGFTAREWAEKSGHHGVVGFL